MSLPAARPARLQELLQVGKAHQFLLFFHFPPLPSPSPSLLPLHRVFLLSPQSATLNPAGGLGKSYKHGGKDCGSTCGNIKCCN